MVHCIFTSFIHLHIYPINHLTHFEFFKGILNVKDVSKINTSAFLGPNPLCLSTTLEEAEINLLPCCKADLGLTSLVHSTPLCATPQPQGSARQRQLHLPGVTSLLTQWVIQKSFHSPPVPTSLNRRHSIPRPPALTGTSLTCTQLLVVGSGCRSSSALALTPVGSSCLSPRPGITLCWFLPAQRHVASPIPACVLCLLPTPCQPVSAGQTPAANSSALPGAGLLQGEKLLQGWDGGTPTV